METGRLTFAQTGLKLNFKRGTGAHKINGKAQSSAKSSRMQILDEDAEIKGEGSETGRNEMAYME